MSSNSRSIFLHDILSCSLSASQVTAIDLDGPQNNIIRYSIVSGDPWQQFSIDPQTGHIKVRAMLDREEVSSFLIQVKEGGSNKRRSTCCISAPRTSTDLFPWV